MPRISFRGIGIIQKIDDMAAVVTPPYDVIDSTAQKYYEKPYNVIRLEFGYQFPEDKVREQQIHQGSPDYRGWLENEVLIRKVNQPFTFMSRSFPLMPLTT